MKENDIELLGRITELENELSLRDAMLDHLSNEKKWLQTSLDTAEDILPSHYMMQIYKSAFFKTIT